MALEHPSGFLRLFIAIAVPPEVREEIGRAQGRLKRDAPRGAVGWTQPDRFHVTLKFLGDVPAEQVGEVQKFLRTIGDQSPTLLLSAQGVGFFPSAHKPRVIWAGADEKDDRGRLPALHRKIDEALRRLAPADRPERFTGHITLGRIKPGHYAAIPRLVELAAGLRDRHFGNWRADAVELVRSELASDGAMHTVMATFPLAGASGHRP